MSATFKGDSRTAQTKDEWLTPPALIKALGKFDLDPSAPVNRPWPTAKKHLTILDDGLASKWSGRVWLNPPYGKFAPQWMAKLAEHGDGVGLVFVRSSSRWFQECSAKASAMLFLLGRVQFHHVDGTVSKQCPAPSVLFAFGERNAIALQKSGIPGLLFHPPFRITK